MKRILILGGNLFQIPVVETAKEMGLYVGIVDIDEKAPALPYADEAFTCSIKDKTAVLEIAKIFNADAILCGACDTGVVTAAFICQTLGLPGLTEDVAIKATDKLRMIQTFRENGVPHPAFQVVRKYEDFKLNEDMQYPLIVKPIDGAGSRGLDLINNENELKEKVKKCSDFGTSGDVLLEEYMQGPEVSVEVLVVNGTPHVLQITDKTTTGAPNFIEIGQSQPSSLPKNTKETIASVASKAVLAVGLYNSAAHVEIKVTEQGPKMVELGARLGGDYITSYLINASISGVNMMQATISLALGDSPDVSNYSNNTSYIAMRAILSEEGVLTDISGLDAAERLNGVLKVIMNAKINERYVAAKSNTDRVGYIFATANTKEEAMDICSKALDAINIQYIR